MCEYRHGGVAMMKKVPGNGGSIPNRNIRGAVYAWSQKHFPGFTCAYFSV